MCEIMDPYTSRSLNLACEGAMKGKYDGPKQKIEN